MHNDIVIGLSDRQYQILVERANGAKLHPASYTRALVEAALAAPFDPSFPKEKVNIPDPHKKGARIVGFRIREGDAAWGEHGLSEPLFWLDAITKRSQP